MFGDCRSRLQLRPPNVYGKRYGHGVRATEEWLLLFSDKAPRYGVRTLPLPGCITTPCLKASGKLSCGGSSWALLLGAKQTGPLVTVCSFSGVTGGASYNLFEA